MIKITGNYHCYCYFVLNNDYITTIVINVCPVQILLPMEVQDLVRDLVLSSWTMLHVLELRLDLLIVIIMVRVYTTVSTLKMLQ